MNTKLFFSVLFSAFVFGSCYASSAGAGAGGGVGSCVGEEPACNIWGPLGEMPMKVDGYWRIPNCHLWNVWQKNQQTDLAMRLDDEGRVIALPSLVKGLSQAFEFGLILESAAEIKSITSFSLVGARYIAIIYGETNRLSVYRVEARHLLEGAIERPLGQVLDWDLYTKVNY